MHDGSGIDQLQKAGAAPVRGAWKGGFWRTLSGRFLILTVVFVMVAEVLIFVPSIARFRVDFLTMRLEKAQIAALAQLAAPDMVTPELERELLANAEVFNVVLRRNEVRELVLSSQLPQPISQTFDLRSAGPMVLIRDAFAALLGRTGGIIRVIGQPVQDAGLLIEITMDAAPLRAALVDYGARILALSAVISAITALALFLAVQRLMVAPIRRVVKHMQSYAEAPEDGRRVINPTSRVDELRRAEEAMALMQTQLTQALRQKERLAQLGGAVAKISHDLRNILTSAQLFVDRIEGSQDPAVARAAPKLVGSISRAVALCESTLTFGRAEEAAPQQRAVDIALLARDVAEADGIDAATPVTLVVDAPKNLFIWADPEQLYRVLSNLIRNARQAIEAQGGEAQGGEARGGEARGGEARGGEAQRATALGKGGQITVSAGQTPVEYWVMVADTGPGLPTRARAHLFEAFSGSARKGGTGLGLAISAELVRGHGGRLELLRSTAQGTAFILHLPKEGAQT